MTSSDSGSASSSCCRSRPPIASKAPAGRGLRLSTTVQATVPEFVLAGRPPLPALRQGQCVNGVVRWPSRTPGPCPGGTSPGLSFLVGAVRRARVTPLAESPVPRESARAQRDSVREDPSRAQGRREARDRTRDSLSCDAAERVSQDVAVTAVAGQLDWLSGSPGPGAPWLLGGCGWAARLGGPAGHSGSARDVRRSRGRAGAPLPFGTATSSGRRPRGRYRCTTGHWPVRLWDMACLGALHCAVVGSLWSGQDREAAGAGVGA